MTNLHDENQIVAELPSSASDDYVLVTREQRMTWYGAASGAALFGIAILLPIMLMIAALVFPMGRSAPSVRRSAGVVVIIGGLLVAVPASRWYTGSCAGNGRCGTRKRAGAVATI